MARRYWYREMLPFAAMVAAECSNVGTNILFKAATLKGMSYYVFVAYSFAISNFLLLPFVFISRSSSSVVLPSFSFPLISRICLLGFIGFFGQILGYKGIENTSPTLASAISNLRPAFTFILAFIFRMERLVFRSSSTQAKVIGTMVSISGALVVLFYKGPTVFSFASSVSLKWPLGSSQSNWLIGGLLLVAENFLFSIGYIVQAQVMKIYPAEFNVVFLLNLFGTIVSVPVCLIAEPNLSSWILRPRIAVAAVIYSGFISSIISVVMAWCLHLKGPVYVAIFKPLAIAIAAIMSALFLGDALHLGSVIGAIVISLGFYAVIWGQAKEEVILVNDDQSPLLESYKVENV
ncbi:hypothetical protein SLA2020_099300 [Shorea laevis]